MIKKISKITQTHDADKTFYLLRYRLWIVVLFAIFVFFNFRAYELIFHSPLPMRSAPAFQPVRRGSILDRRNFELAISLDTISVAARPAKIINAKQTAFLLSEILPLSEKEILRKIQSAKQFVWLLRKIPMDEESAVKKLNLPGIVVQVEPSRLYPNGRLASALLGFVGIDNEGLSGTEFYYNNELTNRQNDSSAGNNIQLTIDSFVQYQVEKVLRQEMQKSGAKAAVGIVSQVDSGEILAMASLPDFDPNRPLDFPKNTYRNRAISEQYEPGSIFKIFTVASLMRSGLFNEKKIYYCDGFFRYKRVEIRDTHKHGRQTMREVIKNSCNSGIIQAAWEMPVNTFYQNLQYFGFGSKTNIGLPGEESGILHPPEDWDIFLKATIPIGHGVAVTPMQLVTAANAIANGGQMLKPVVLKRIVSPDNKVLQETPVRQLLKLNTKHDARQIMSYLTSVVAEGGTGKQAAISNFTTAGKTGTTIKSDGTRYVDKYQASFVGFFPAEKPEVSIFIWFDEPKGDKHQGGTIAAPAFRQILLDILPVVHRGKTYQAQKLPFVSLEKEAAKKTAANGQKNNFGNLHVMPDFRGLSKKEVLTILGKYYSGEHNLTGAGYVSEQNPPAGSAIDKPYKFVLQFSFPDLNTKEKENNIKE